MASLVRDGNSSTSVEIEDECYYRGAIPFLALPLSSRDDIWKDELMTLLPLCNVLATGVADSTD
jgi:hypothetical protein